MSTRSAQHVRPQRTPGLTVADLAKGLGLSCDAAAIVSGVTISGNEVRPGDLFVGLPGQHTHGAKFAEQARAQGAVALLTDEHGAELIAQAGVTDLPVLIVPEPRTRLGEVAARIYGTDQLDVPVLGVTGTNGKTSTTYFMEALLGHAGHRTGLSTTVERHVGEHVFGSALTTPEASELHALLASMREIGADDLLIEVSAQAVTRHRIDGVRFAVVGFTNLSPEHLDEYGDMQHYYEAKRDLFVPERAERAVISLESEWGRRLAADTPLPVTTIGQAEDAQWRVIDQQDARDGSTATLAGPAGQRWPIVLAVPGAHMAVNAALAIVMLVEAGIDQHALEAALNDHVLAGVYLPGRLERVSGETGPTFFVDYAHTTDALERTLAAVRRQVGAGRLIVILGADGGRDPYKRHDMGMVTSELADVVVVNDINPRFEDPATIRQALIDGAADARHPAEVHEVADPAAAIRAAIALAQPDDTIIVCGPGDEDYHEVRGNKLPYSSRGAAREALREAGFPPNRSPRGGQAPAEQLVIPHPHHDTQADA